MQSSYKKRTFLEYNATTPRINRAANRSAYERIKEHPPILSRAPRESDGGNVVVSALAFQKLKTVRHAPAAPADR